MKRKRGRFVAWTCVLLGLVVLAASAVLFRDAIVDRLGLSAASASALRVTEIMYHPRGGSSFEFLELQNTGSHSITLSEVRVRSGVTFSFDESTVTTLAPGDYVVLVRDEAAFGRRYESKRSRVAGEYSGNLGNDGDHIELALADGTAFLSFDYDDSWHSSTDGQGYSLVITDPRAPAESWRMASSWRPSTALYGSPGESDDTTEP